MPDLDLSRFTDTDAEQGRADVAAHHPHPEIKQDLWCAWCVQPWPCPVIRAYVAGHADGQTARRPRNGRPRPARVDPEATNEHP